MYYDITARNVIFSFLQGIADNIHLYIYMYKCRFHRLLYDNN